MNLMLDLEGLETAFLTLVIAFIITVMLAPGFIPMLHRLKFGQEVRDDGPQSHLKKQGTPTMGGIMFLIAIIAGSLIGSIRFGRIEPEMLQILLMTAGFGLIGLADDYLKIKRHKSDGLSPKQKLLLQLVLTVIFALWVWMHQESGQPGGRVFIPFTGDRDAAMYVDLPVWLFVPFVVFVVLGTDNGVNFTDGLDGLCSSVTSVTASFFLILGLAYFIPGMSIVSAAVAGGLLGFLLFNVYPARVFMGDTGSLALGGFVASAAVVSGTELYIPVVGFIYMIEVISVIIQVGYFKATHGKRFFKMAPIHHHFELLGNSETRIVAAFTIVTILLSGAALIGALHH